MTGTHAGDSHSKSGLKWQEPENFNVVDEKLDSFHQTKKDSFLFADEFLPWEAKLASWIDLNLEEQLGKVLMKFNCLSSEYQTEITSMIGGTWVLLPGLWTTYTATVPVKQSLMLTDNSPIYSRIRPLPPQHNEFFSIEIDKMLSAGIITPSNSARSLPIVIAGNKYGKIRCFCWL